MLNKTEPNLSLPDRQLRHALAVRIAMILLAFFTVAWSLLQWALTSEQRFMVEGITRQFVTIEAFVCAGIAVIAFIVMVANGLGWLATTIKMRRQQSGAARKLAMKRSAHRVGAYV